MRKFLQKGASQRGSIASTVIELAIGAFLLAVLLPLAITEIATATTTDWDANVITIVQVVLPILIAIGAAMVIYNRAKEQA